MHFGVGTGIRRFHRKLAHGHEGEEGCLSQLLLIARWDFGQQTNLHFIFPSHSPGPILKVYFQKALAFLFKELRRNELRKLRIWY